MTTRHTVPVMTSRLEAPDDDPDALVLGPAAAVSAPSGPVVRLHITVMARPAFIRIGLCWFTCQSALALALGTWFADARLHGAVATSVAFAAVCWWYLHYPVGVYEPATNTYIEAGPFGIWLRRRPAAAGQTLAVLGDRIVTTGRRPRTVISAALIRPGEWASIAASVRKSSDRPIEPAGSLDRPAYFTPRHRAAGIAVAAIAAAGLLHLGAHTAIECLDVDVRAAWTGPAVDIAEGR